MIRYLLIFLLFPLIVFSQSYSIKGIVLNSKDKKPLQFVSLVIKNSPKGTLSDSLGAFSLNPVRVNDTLLVSLVGFERKTFIINSKESFLTIFLNEQQNALDEVTIRPTENPAWEIIRRVLKNKTQNDPQNFESFQTDVYTKIILGGDSIRSTKIDSISKKRDTNRVSMPLYILENFSKLYHKNPKKNKEVIEASVNSFLQVYSQFFNNIPFDVHLLSFYHELYNFVPLKRFYVNPINKNTFKQYDFELKDTLINASDSTYIIDFKPLPQTNFDGLVGQLAINSENYAIEKFSFSQSDKYQNLGFIIEQNYKKIGNKFFPSKNITQLISNATNDKISGKFYLKFTSYYTNTKIDFPLSDSLFDETQRVLLPEASRSTNLGFEKYRTDTLSASERKMYDLFKKNKTFSTIQKYDSTYGFVLSNLLSGVFEFGKIEFLTSDLFSTNSFEGFKIGIGFQNNQRLKPKFRIYLNGNYGILDKRFKYNFITSWHITPDRYNKLSAYYQFGIREAATTDFLQPNYLVENPYPIPLSITDSLNLPKIDYFKKYGFSGYFKPFRWNWFRISLNFEEKKPAYLYQFNAQNKFKTTEIIFDWRFAFKEQLYRIGRNENIVNRYFPIINFQAIKGLNVWGGKFDYWKLTTKATYQIRYRRIGFTNIRTEAGFIDSPVPYPFLYSSFGNIGQINLFGSSGIYTFKTLTNSGLIADRFAAIYLNHDFNRNILRLKTKYSQPRIVVFNNVLFGKLKYPLGHDMNWISNTKNFHAEAGIELKDLIRVSFRGIYLGSGIGVAYNYYPFDSKITNQNLRIYWLGILPSQ